jgi:tetratricopeptide (TPR) repeat protein
MTQRIRLFLALAALVIAACICAPSSADTLTTMDGKSLSGKIEKTTTGYIVYTADGVVTVPDANVKHVMLDHAADRTPGHKKLDPKTVVTLQAQGRAAYAAGAFDVARDLYLDASHVEPGNAVTARGLGMAYMRLERPAQAIEPLEQAKNAMPNDRELLIVLSTALIESHNPMRAVKFVKTYMEKNPATVDEDCLNALGAGLSQADPTAAKQTLFAEAYKLYLKDNAKLEALRPGEKRWGSQWLPAEDVATKVADRKKAQADVNTYTAKIAKLDDQIAGDQRTMAQYSGTLGDNNRSRIYDQAKNDAAKAQKQLETAQKDLADAQAALAATEPAPFPLLVTLDSASSESAGATTQSTTEPAGVGATTEPAGGGATTEPDAIATAKPKPDATSDKGNPPPAVDTTPKPPATPLARAVKPNANAEATGPVTQYGAAFAVAPDLIVAPTSVIVGAKILHVDVAVGPSFEASIVRVDAAAGLVLIRVPGANLTPLKIADPADDKPTTCLGFPSVDIFNPMAETMQVSKSTSGAPDHAKFSMPPRIPGAPLLQDKAVIGMETAGRDTDPAEVPVVSASVLRKFVGDDAAPAAKDSIDSVVQVVAQR